jgi:hypothetical protein
VLSRQPLTEPQWIKEILRKRKASDSTRTIEELTSGRIISNLEKASAGSRTRKTTRRKQP